MEAIYKKCLNSFAKLELEIQTQECWTQECLTAGLST